MRITGFMAVLGVLVCFCGQKAEAADFIDRFFTPPMPDFERPYLEDGRTSHSQALWELDEWQPENWTKARGSKKNVIDAFYRNGIITDQYDEDDVPVLEVGQTFLRLSGQEQRRVTAYIDDVFGVTRSSEHGMFYIFHEESCTTLGVYTKHGLQLH